MKSETGERERRREIKRGKEGRIDRNMEKKKNGERKGEMESIGVCRKSA